VDSPDRPSAHSESLRPARWYQRVLPLTLVVVVVVGLAAAVVPGLRHQLALSVTRQSVPYVELYFSQPTSVGTRAVCARKGASVSARFVIESHLERRQPVSYRVTVDPSTEGLRTRRQAGSAQVSPGEAVEVSRTFTLQGREGYVVSVTLPALGQQLRVRCPRRP
jgi:hypothetical protein